MGVHDQHLCASLPKRHVTVHLTFCEHHQAWTISHHSYVEDGESITDVDPYIAVDLGPFDRADDAAAIAAAWLAESLPEG